MAVLSIALGVAGGVAALFLLTWHGLSYWQVDLKCEKPKYTILRTVGRRKTWFGLSTEPAVQIREYAPYLVAEVILEETDMKTAMSAGFKQIAGFIFGKNTGRDGTEGKQVAMTSPVAMEKVQGHSEKIAMTSPVTSQLLGPSQYLISFIMPSEYTLQTLPKPNDPNIKIKEVAAHRMAAMGWRGSSPNLNQTMQKQAKLKQYLAEEGIEVKSNVHLYQYHPPFSPPWMRLNEVLFKLL